MDAPLTETKETVIYTVEICAANKGAWYRSLRYQSFDCILDIMDRTVIAQEVVFRVLGAYKPVKYIKTYHCVILSQRLGQQKELTQLYGPLKHD